MGNTKLGFPKKYKYIYIGKAQLAVWGWIHGACPSCCSPAWRVQSHRNAHSQHSPSCDKSQACPGRINQLPKTLLGKVSLGEGAPGVRWVGLCSSPAPSDPSASSPPTTFHTSFIFFFSPKSPFFLLKTKKIFPPTKKKRACETSPNLGEKVEPCWSKRAFMMVFRVVLFFSKGWWCHLGNFGNSRAGMSFPPPNSATALGAALGTTFAFYPCPFSFFPLRVFHGMRSGHIPVSLCPEFCPRGDGSGRCQRVLAQGAELCHQPG